MDFRAREHDIHAIKDKVKDITVSVNISPIQLMDAEFDTL
jgi:hypothetical protein